MNWPERCPKAPVLHANIENGTGTGMNMNIKATGNSIGLSIGQ
jgi:hypothetical protein